MPVLLVMASQLCLECLPREILLHELVEGALDDPPSLFCLQLTSKFFHGLPLQRKDEKLQNCKQSILRKLDVMFDKLRALQPRRIDFLSPFAVLLLSCIDSSSFSLFNYIYQTFQFKKRSSYKEIDIVAKLLLSKGQLELCEAFLADDWKVEMPDLGVEVAHCVAFSRSVELMDKLFPSSFFDRNITLTKTFAIDAARIGCGEMLKKGASRSGPAAGFIALPDQLCS